MHCCLSPFKPHSHISERCLATALRVSSSITTGRYILNKDLDPKRLGSENNASASRSNHERLRFVIEIANYIEIIIVFI